MDPKQKFNFERVELIDITSFTQNGNQDDRKKVTDHVRKVCTESGFFYLTGHGVSEQLQNKIKKVASTFFNLPLEQKNKIHMKKGGKPWRGYFSTGEQLTSGKIDYKQGLYLGQQLDESHPLVQEQTPLHGRSQYPQHPQQLKQVVLEWMEVMQKLGQTLMQIIALSLNLAPEFFRTGICKDPLCLFRIFKYHKGPEGQESWGVGEHTDYGLLTILMVTASGLQVKNRQNNWVKADLIPNSFVINIGDMLERMTKGLYRSTPHRVRMEVDCERLSFPFFFDPGWTEQINQLKIQVEENQKILIEQQTLQERWDHQKLTEMKGTYGDYLTNKVSLVFPDLAKDNLPQDKMMMM